jgi:hypothetical protein
MSFRDLSDAMDSVIFGELGDAVQLDGRPLLGVFETPWVGPHVGHLRTDIVEPYCEIREADAMDAARGSKLVFDGATYDVMRLEPDGSGLVKLILRPPA